jgi:hypothetical protein
MRFVSTAFGLIIATVIPVGAKAGQDGITLPTPWGISSPVTTAQNASWHAPASQQLASPSAGAGSTLANGFGHSPRYSLGTEWALRAAVVALRPTGNGESNQQRYAGGDMGAREASWNGPAIPPIDIRTGSSQTVR